MKRPIFIAMIGYIIGILVGQYLKISIVPFYFFIIAIYLAKNIIQNHKFNLKQDKIENKISVKRNKKLELLSFKRFFRYIKIYLNSKTMILIIISSIISNSIVIIQNKNYEQTYNNLESKEKISLTGIIISNKEEKDYNNKYKIETYYNNKKIKLYITTSKDIMLEYGDKIEFTGKYIRPETQRNYKGYDYSNYLKQLKIYGTIKATNVKLEGKKRANYFFQVANDISTKIISKTKKLLDKDTSSVLLGLILGYKVDIEEEKQENFKNAGMAHVLAVSGMHVTYVILGISILLKNVLGKRKNYIFCIFILIFYMFITNFSPSITRAGIMGIIMIFSKVIYRKNDIYTSISISLLLMLIYNPFLIQNLGLLLSYGGVVGIVILNKTILTALKNIRIKNKTYKYFIRPKIQTQLDKIKEIISISISVQIFILPIIINNLNTFNPYFLISNLILSLLIGTIVIIGFLFIIIILIDTKLAIIFSKIVKIGIQILIFISKIGELPYSKIYLPTQSLFSIITYYILLIMVLVTYKIYSAKNPNKTQIRARNIIALIKIKIRNKKTQIKYLMIIIFTTIVIINLVPKNLRIYFIDVGQGDSTLIITPRNKKILIDGGGSENSSYDVGESILLPYILDRGINSIDTIIISHFDSDHVRADC